MQYLKSLQLADIQKSGVCEDCRVVKSWSASESAGGRPGVTFCCAFYRQTCSMVSKAWGGTPQARLQSSGCKSCIGS
jgi:hypothetical protein